MVPDDWPVLSFLGLTAVLISICGILGALALAPWFSVLEHPLSDLGSAGRVSAPVFNLALITSGTLGLGFVTGLWRRTEIWVRRLGLSMFGVAAGFVILIGVYPTPHSYHYPLAVGFYVTLTFALFVHGTGEVIAGNERFGLTTIWLGIVHTAAWLGWWRFMDGQGIAAPEVIGAVVFSVWVVSMVWRSYRSSRVVGMGFVRQS